MDQDLLVESELSDGRRFLEELVQRGEEIRAAGWVKKAGSGRWRLYLALPGVNKTDVRNVYLRILPVLRERPQPLLVEGMGLSLIDAKDPMAVAMADFERRYPGRQGVLRYPEGRLGNVDIEGAYIYPAMTPSASSPE